MRRHQFEKQPCRAGMSQVVVVQELRASHCAHTVVQGREQSAFADPLSFQLRDTEQEIRGWFDALLSPPLPIPFNQQLEFFWFEQHPQWEIPDRIEGF